MAGELLLKMWPKDERKCNIGDCPAFHLTDQDWEDVVKSSKVAKEKGMDEAIRKCGIPVGTCKVTGAEVIVNSKCSVLDEDFVDYYCQLSDEL